MKKKCYGIILSLSILFLSAPGALAGLKSTLFSELHGGVNARIYYGNAEYSSWAHFYNKGYLFNLETDSYGMEIRWNREGEINRILDIRIKTPAGGGEGEAGSRWFLRIHEIDWENIVFMESFDNDGPAGYELSEISFGQEYEIPLIFDDNLKLNLGLDWCIPLYSCLDFSEYTYYGFPAGLAGKYSLWGIAGNAGLSLEAKLNPQTGLFVSVDYGLHCYWSGSILNMIIIGIDAVNDEIDFGYVYEPGEPYARTEFFNIVTGLRYRF